jgi:hypothetical protein
MLEPMSESAPVARTPQRRWLALGSGSAIALGVLIGFATARATGPRGEGAWDNVPDPQVGRVLQPNLRARKAGGIEIDSNRYGLRERDFVVPKPAGTLRIVLLGDSYVYGNAVAAQVRLGAQLERELAARRAGDRTIECLHVAMTGWNLEAESAYLRRSLAVLEPDLVVHVSVHNDLEDSFDARGFGALAAHGSQVRAHADGLVGLRTGQMLHAGALGMLADGLDWESRTRYERAAAALAGLAQALRSRGCPYLVLFHWPLLQPLAREHLARVLAPEQVAWLPSPLAHDERYIVSESDPHWNAQGHALVARALYELLRERALLPELALPEWDEAAAVRTGWLVAGAAEAAAGRRPLLLARASRALRSIGATAWTAASAGQVHAGLDREGRASPYLSVLLACAPGRRVKLRGARLGGGALLGRARVWVDQRELGAFELGGPLALEQSWDLPPELSARPHVSVRIQSEDWTYAEDLRHTLVFRLDELSIER